MLKNSVRLAGTLRSSGSIRLTPNANAVATRLAAAAAGNGLKTIVFVNAKLDAVRVAQEISASLDLSVEFTEVERSRWEALEVELGGQRHSFLSGPSAAVPHNSAMLRLERDVAERMFKRPNGARVIVATPTLAQGLNLPAQLAVLAGDKRADLVNGGREDLKAHEILNAAARAGRAGHLANGLVLMIPEPIISFTPNEPLDADVIEKLKAVLPEDDHCVTVTDPLEFVLDRLTVGAVNDPDVRYVINRMSALRDADGAEEPSQLFDLRKSFGAYSASNRSAEKDFDHKVAALKKAVADQSVGEVEETIAILATRSGLSVPVLVSLRDRISNEIGTLPESIEDWLTWVIGWLIEDDDARATLLQDIAGSILSACGKKKDAEVGKVELQHILLGLLAWVKGEPFNMIEEVLGGEPNAAAFTKRTCPRARELASSIVPRGISFITGLVAQIVIEIAPFEAQPSLDKQVIECLGSAVRKGFDTVGKLFFAAENPTILSRVQVHRVWREQRTPNLE
ncbi:hypothetical protein PXJ20_30110 [Paraburkholderia sp. A1RI_3L]|uniref:hypothetical protein n=1 Tax=Paraburkholderia TaxID=1822464 RepID=UPI003B819BA9